MKGIIYSQGYAGGYQAGFATGDSAGYNAAYDAAESQSGVGGLTSIIGGFGTLLGSASNITSILTDPTVGTVISGIASLF
jgi:hypothetical protein